MATPKENELILSCRDLVTQPNEKVTKCMVVEMKNSFSMARVPQWAILFIKIGGELTLYALRSFLQQIGEKNLVHDHTLR